MPDLLQVRIKATVGFNIGMADQMAGLRLFSAKMTFFTHDGILRIKYEKIRAIEPTALALMAVTCENDSAKDRPAVQRAIL